MPEGWMVDREGNPLTDPTRQSEGLLLPIGGAKGYGLAMAIGLIAGTLNGAVFGKDVVNFTKETDTPTNTGQFVAALSIEAFGDVGIFKETVDGIFASFRQSASFPGENHVRIPGQDRGNVREDREKNGIPLHQNLVKILADIAAELNIPELKAI
jgi:LDH2 family malate/lactate/ureidoglycolate dehydrogenase